MSISSTIPVAFYDFTDFCDTLFGANFLYNFHCSIFQFCKTKIFNYKSIITCTKIVMIAYFQTLGNLLGFFYQTIERRNFLNSKNNKDPQLRTFAMAYRIWSIKNLVLLYLPRTLVNSPNLSLIELPKSINFWLYPWSFWDILPLISWIHSNVLFSEMALPEEHPLGPLKTPFCWLIPAFDVFNQHS